MESRLGGFLVVHSGLGAGSQESFEETTPIFSAYRNSRGWLYGLPEGAQLHGLPTSEIGFSDDVVGHGRLGRFRSLVIVVVHE
jgi:hypothetical protein